MLEKYLSTEGSPGIFQLSHHSAFHPGLRKKSVSKPIHQNPRPNKNFPITPSKKTPKMFLGGVWEMNPPKFTPMASFPPSGGGKTCPSPTTPPVDRPRVRVRCQVNPPRLRWSTGARWPQRRCPVGCPGGEVVVFFPSKMIFPRFPFLLVGDFLGFF